MEDSYLYCDEIPSEEKDQEMQQGNDDNDDDDDDDDDADDNDDDGDDDDDEDDEEMKYLQILIVQEIAVPRLNDQEFAEIMNDNWNQEVRTWAIDYILKTGQEFRLSRQTLYTSVIYIDRFIASQIIVNGEYWAVRLLAVACLSLSAKSNENRDNVPSLSDYPLGSYSINVKDIRRTEFLVLDELNWNMNCVIPLSFTRFFVSRFCREVGTRYITRMRTFDIIMSVLADWRLMNHRPSVISAAATLLALSTNLTREALEILINDLPINEFLQIDDVCYCYNRLREMNQHI